EPTISETWRVVDAHGGLRINEVLASNQGSFVHDGRRPDAIELFNDGTTPVDLGGMSISDDLTFSAKYVFPAGTRIEPGEYLTLIADDIGAGTTGLYLGFKLSDEGEGIYLFNTAAAGGALLDSVEFGVQVPDRSI